MSRASRKEKYLKERQDGFNLDLCTALPEYNALLDPNMRHYFENEIVQAHLLQTGQIDRFGRIITLDKHRLVRNHGVLDLYVISSTQSVT